MANKKEKFDEKLVLVVPDDFGINNKKPLSKNYFSYNRDKDKFVKERIDSIASRIEDGRVQLSLLIDSRGGSDFERKVFASEVKDIDRKGGRILSFGGANMASAAAFLFMLPKAESRFTMPHSKLFFHLSDKALVDKNIRKQEQKETWDLLRDSVIAEKREEMRALLKTAFSQTEFTDCRIEFNKAQIHYFGLASPGDDLVQNKSRNSMKSRLKKLSADFNNMNRVTSKAYEGTPIFEFFENAFGVEVFFNSYWGNKSRFEAEK